MTEPSPTAALATLADDFDLMEDWEQRFALILDLGRALPAFPDAHRTEQARVRGCASQVWLTSALQPDGRLHFAGDSDALLVKGLMAIVLRLFDQRTPAEILAFDADAALTRLGLSEALTPQRSNGLAAMVRRILAVAAEAQTKAQPTPA